MEKIRVLIVDDHPLFRQGVRHTLESSKDIEVIGEAPDGQRAIQMAESLAPDIMLVDINLPGLNGLEVTRVVRRRQPQIAVIVLTVYEDDEQLFNATKVGAAAYSAKDITTEKLMEMVREVSEGHYPINDAVLSRPFVASRMLNQFRELASAETDGGESVFAPLTTREVEILDCIARGNSNKEIARILNISDQTVKNHITSILRKLAVNDRTQAVIYALRHGWIKMSEE
ncbi:MAG: response regulator transcription factor [Chloroflexi bacterium]|nr:response regulator transcription factor [Chloroflexota bacterium]